MTRDVELENIEISLVLEAIHARYGYDLRGYVRSSMRRRVHDALARSGATDLAELQHRLLRDPVLFANVLDQLTVRVSELFRDPRFYRAFRERVVPVLRTYPTLKIWHCGCANGEEVYSMAILLTEEGLYDRCQIYATDLSATALTLAKEGIYEGEKLARFTENYEATGLTGRLSRHTTEAYGHVAMNESLRKNVLFFQHNLVSDYVFGEMNVVLCRNVLIYFGEDLKEKVMQKMTRSLCPGGVLCLGSSERPARNDANAVLAEMCPDERIYRYEP